MKTLLFISLSLLMTITVSAQDYVAELVLSKIKPAKSTKKMNKIYLSEVDTQDQAEYILDVHSRISNFNVKDLKEYKGHDRPFDVKFKFDKGNMIVSYDVEGNIISTTERYINVKVPKPLLREALKGYEGWVLSRTKYVLTYNEGKKEDYYQIQIEKDGEKKQLKVDATGREI